LEVCSACPFAALQISAFPFDNSRSPHAGGFTMTSHVDFMRVQKILPKPEEFFPVTHSHFLEALLKLQSPSEQNLIYFVDS